ncbi:MAG: sugar ABC transporter ATP-binding protein [Firmicutes bacterium]|nr:sugar ABC transporter ATP-binding protein [Bacillota bacterium]
MKDYGSTRALDHVSFTLEHGKIYGLVGENGAGKSTVVKIISGGVRQDQGEIFFEGLKVTELNPNKAREMGISIVHQSGDLAPNLTVLENMFLGHELTKWGGRLDKSEMQKKAREILSTFGVDVDLDTKVETLSAAYQQIITICKALTVPMKLMIVDEGGASLDKDELAKLFAVLRKLKAQGVSVIYISHLLDDVLELCDDIIVLRNGELIDVVSAKALTVSELSTYVVGHEVKSSAEQRATKLSKDQKELFRVEGVTYSGNNEKYSFTVKAGEILGITGPVGSGKSELLRAIMGLTPPPQGAVYLNGREIKNRSPITMVKEGVAFIPEDRFDEGLVVFRSIEENITLPNLWRWYKLMIDQLELNERAEQAAATARIKMASLQHPISSLSGGNQQKALIARWLTGSYKCFIFDEPYKGIDIGAKMDISNVLTELASQGCSVIIASTEFSDLIGLVHRMIVMVKHRIVGELEADQITNRNIINYYQRAAV